jgi:diguanylate cyclase (GGDEF)-like protein
MNLHKRTLISISLTILALTLLVNLIARLVFLNAFKVIESETAQHHYNQVLEDFKETLANLEAFTYDWAVWDDTYQYIEDHNADYARSKLLDEAFSNIGIDLVMYYDISGDLVFGKYFSSGSSTGNFLPDEIKALLPYEDQPGDTPAEGAYPSGLLRFDGSILLVSMHPILKSDGQGPPRGAIVFGKRLDEDYLQGVEERLGVQAVLYPGDQPDLPNELKEQWIDPSLRDSLQVQFEDNETIAVSGVVQDLFSQPAAILIVRDDRPFFSLGVQTVSFVTLSVFGGGLLLGALVVISLNYLILGRLAALTRSVSDIARTADRTRRVQLQGKDELGQLAGSINGMLDALAVSEANLQKKADELAALHAVTAEITVHRDLSTLLNMITEKAVTLLGGTNGVIFLCNPERQELTCAVSYNTHIDYTGLVLKYGEGAAGIVAQTGKPLIIADYKSWEYRSPTIGEDHPYQSLLSAPMIWQGETIGVIHVMHQEKMDFFTEQDVELLSLFARQAAIAVENARLFEQVKRQANEAETLRQASSAVVSSLNQDEAIRHILEQLARVLPYDSASVQLLRDGYIEIVGGRGWSDDHQVIGMRFPIPGDNPNTVVIQSRDPHVLNDAPASYESFRTGPHSHIKSWLGVPLIIHDQVIGMLAIDSTRPDYFTEEHIEKVSAFADHVAISIENARLYQDLQRRIAELAAVRATAADIAAELDLSHLLEAILERAVRLLNASGGDLGLFDEASQELEIFVSHNMGRDYTGVRQVLGEGAMGQAALRREPVIVDDYQSWEWRSAQFEGGFWNSVIAAPLLHGSRLVGSIGIVAADPQRRFNKRDQELLTMFAQHAAIAVENARLYKEKRQEAITDELTGLYNRRGLFELGQREVERLQRFEEPLSAIMMDIDHFKQINDAHSHKVGDQVLRALAQRCKKILREVDLIGRYGGEEFAILLPGTGLENACVVAERLRREIEIMPVYTDHGPVPVTISLGVSTVTPDIKELAVLLDRADTAMYQAKQAGRNRVGRWEPELLTRSP